MYCMAFFVMFITSCSGNGNNNAKESEETVAEDTIPYCDSVSVAVATSKPSKWEYTSKTDPMNDAVTHMAHLKAEEVRTVNGKKLQMILLIHYVDGGESATVSLGLDEGCSIDKYAQIKYRFDKGEVESTSFATTIPHLMFVAHDANTSKKWINRLKQSDKLAVQIPTDDGSSVTYTFQTNGLNWDYSPSVTETSSKAPAKEEQQVPKWLIGRWVRERIDYTYSEIIYEIMVFNESTFTFSEKSSDSGRATKGVPIPYYVKDNVIYNSNNNEPLLRINSSNKTLSRYQYPDDVYKKK